MERNTKFFFSFKEIHETMLGYTIHSEGTIANRCNHKIIFQRVQLNYSDEIDKL